jgi:hypothetical protein
MGIQIISFKTPPPKCSTGMPLPQGSDVPTMQPRTGPRGTDREMVKLLESAMDGLSSAICSFWACNGPRRPKHMCTCSKCYAMREIGTVIATLKAREHVSRPRDPEPPFVPFVPSTKSVEELQAEIVADLHEAIKAFER